MRCSIVFAYMRHFGNPFFAIIPIVMSLLSCAATFGTSLWVALWVDASQRGEAIHISFYLGIYAAWSSSEVLFDILAELAYENGGWYAARTLHRSVMEAVLSVPLSWYKKTPVGRVVNRFSQDIGSIDTRLASMVRWVSPTS
jgi:ABC-type multidrug transport system fused ATPase/permease subunit